MIEEQGCPRASLSQAGCTCNLEQVQPCLKRRLVCCVQVQGQPEHASWACFLKLQILTLQLKKLANPDIYISMTYLMQALSGWLGPYMADVMPRYVLNSRHTLETSLNRRIPFGDEGSNVSRCVLFCTNSAMNLSTAVETLGLSAHASKQHRMIGKCCGCNQSNSNPAVQRLY